MDSVGTAALWRLVGKSTNPIVPLRNVGEGLPFFCVHPIGGETSSFRDLARHIGSQFSFYGIQVPSELLNAEFASSVENIAKHYVSALMAFQPEGRLMIAGWSAGSVVALEMAQRLQACGRNVEMLVLFDGDLKNTEVRSAPLIPSNYCRWVRNVPRWVMSDLLSHEARRLFRNRIKASSILVAYRACGIAPGRLHPVDTIMDTTRWPDRQRAFARALYDAVEAYVPKPYGGTVLLYIAKTRPLRKLGLPAVAWARICPSLEVVETEGNHVTMLTEPKVIGLAADLRNRIARLRDQERVVA